MTMIKERIISLHPLILLHLCISLVAFHHHRIDRFCFQRVRRRNHLQLIPRRKDISNVILNFVVERDILLEHCSSKSERYDM